MTDGSTPRDEAVQLSLLQGFASPAKPRGATVPAGENPVAEVLIESAVPHLDRVFDYLVPQEAAAEAVPGARIKARFGGQEISGYITGRKSEAAEGVRLSPLAKVVSAQPVLTPELLELAGALARRYAGTLSDVIRAAIPPRVAKVDKEFAAAGRLLPGAPPGEEQEQADEPGLEAGAVSTPADAADPALCFAGYRSAAAFLAHLAAGESPRAVLSSHKSYGPASWTRQLAAAVAATLTSGRGALVVVPDAKDLDLLGEALEATIGAEAFVRLSADDGPTPRYRNYLKLLHGTVKVAIGTRSAAYAPVRELGLVAIWDDGDDLYVEQRAPYQHTREVLLLRAEQTGCAALLAGIARSTESQRLVETGWAQPLQADRPALRALTPRVVNTADTFQQERDPLLRHARLPQAAWRAAREGLEHGPVLVQVARTGFSPAMACQDCRTPARCTECQGPLGQAGHGTALTCRWCGRLAAHWRCGVCGSGRLRALVIGASRTAEELGRAFPGATVISSAGDHVKATVKASKAVVVATPGAEPAVAGGYAAALLLDGNSLLSRESLRAPEDALRRWFTAASLVRPAAEGGTVVITADHDAVVGQLVRWDPAGAASRELALRRELQLPPALRIAAITGSTAGIETFMSGLELPGDVRTVGPTELENYGAPAGHHRLLLFFSYQQGNTVTGALRARKAAVSAKRLAEPVQVRCDGLDLL
ncbi:primosomal protein N' [Arthrobacter crystallopoietes]|uniref:Probable replication restart protein PriA n=1 Tax=Crystallibacter crystallopoietes TaxID=37928 RepID=A0A1H1GG51_9MICC|nr:primosomal protein N' [Arthrobacter crystallopoietes]AUI52588.1 primosomal protein N' [Arthrobacter crystallopoietes]SDR12167.1 replication restart DNA helicase PriA [Arthrobacter crystallopoietes]